jgi:RNA polymerase sigma factor (TIGR02999 family)
MAPPESSASQSVTALLRAWGAGDRAALDELLPLVYGELRRQAERFMRDQSSGNTLQTTGLVHEAYLRLVEQQDLELQSRAQFFALAAKVMRSVLVDYARARRAAKRGGGARALTLGAAGEIADAASSADAVDVLALNEALTRLAELDPRKSQLVELRYFAGLGIEETAEVLGVSPATVKREWSLARAWLRRELSTD